MENIFFESWDSILRILIVGFFSYVGLVLLFRVMGNRTLSQLNAFDFIVTVALGSTLATVILNKNIPLAEGMIALLLLICLQLAISTISVHSKTIRKVVKTEPFLLFYRGNYLHDSLKKHRVTEDEILQIVRSEGIASLDDVEAVVLETNGQFSVLKNRSRDEKSTLKNVVGIQEQHDLSD